MRTAARLTIGGAVAAGALLVAFAGAALAASPTPAPVKPAATEGPIETLKGTVDTRKSADGDLEYVLNGTVLSVGPHWFWGTKNPLEPYVGKSVSVTGRMETGTPSTKSTTKTKVSSGPEFEVYKVNGTTVRAEGKPAWAGGPKAVGSRHPGYGHP